MSITLKTDYPGSNRINEEPPVYLFEDFLSADECEHLVELARPHMRRAVVSGGDQGMESDGRTGGVHWIPHRQTAVTQSISQRMAELVGLPLVNAESIQVINYGAGQEYKPHYDAWLHDSEAGQRCLARGGQRLVTCLIYLAEVDAGGGTLFPKMDIEVMPRPGRMVLFHNCYLGRTQRHPDSLHGGMPPQSGTKWACNFWFREGSYQDWQPKPATARKIE
jgi:prolyl 4-hydroxylase